MQHADYCVALFDPMRNQPTEVWRHRHEADSPERALESAACFMGAVCDNARAYHNGAIASFVYPDGDCRTYVASNGPFDVTAPTRRDLMLCDVPA